MKKRLLMFLLACLILLSLVVPAMAVDALSVFPTVMSEHELMQQASIEMEPRNEYTRIYWRTFNGVLQFRVWGITSGRWLTEWTNAF